jgi:hypothetical protein
MHAPYDKRKSSQRTEPTSGVGLFILPAFVAIVLVVLAVLQPNAPLLISQAAQAEFVGDVADMPTQIGQPDMAVPVETVRAY